ncbi:MULTISPECIES: hypothetical protein [Bacillales]|uniref:hypothetical protein n=1 Tax=Bacillales TaxID=1385 RepID=UPI001883D801|nr:hypothetical protein [Pseudalkalibacillus hwajinpoensis]MBF0706941.1 hypothetical protein [Pseudalkalibacillus hwajinpoensis]WLR58422.1 hypothetical protein LC071_14695 [Pseudalkalibacillus hwajinpoensis]
MADHKEKPENSSMAMNEKEMAELGKEMEELDTNDEIKKKGKRPDPIQHKKENETE